MVSNASPTRVTYYCTASGRNQIYFAVISNELRTCEEIWKIKLLSNSIVGIEEKGKNLYIIAITDDS